MQPGPASGYPHLIRFLLALSAPLCNAVMLALASSARFAPTCSARSDSIRPRFYLGLDVGVDCVLEDSLDLSVEAELEAVGRSPLGLVGFIHFNSISNSILDVTQTCYRRPWTLRDFEYVYQQFKRYSTLQPIMPLMLLP